MTLGEILAMAASNTLLGMGTVFVVLILISLIIYLLKFIPGGGAKAPAPKAAPAAQAQTAPAAPAAPAPRPLAGDPAGDPQLVAVIMAAILASKGLSPAADEACPYIVRTIRRR